MFLIYIVDFGTRRHPEAAAEGPRHLAPTPTHLAPLPFPGESEGDVLHIPDSHTPDPNTPGPHAPDPIRSRARLKGVVGWARLKGVVGADEVETYVKDIRVV